MERTLVLIKPDALQRELVGDVVTRFERKGLKIVGMKLSHLTEEVLTEHYGHHKEKPFFPGLVAFMRETPVVAMVLEGLGAVDEVRKVVGATNPLMADAGTIRADFSMSMAGNIVHASDTLENAGIEINRFFSTAEVFTYGKLTDRYHFGA
ncbi:TPA: nucleoside-diphosphate kinase [Candidatus Uhrbacteria bacterium]|nr:nucleoside-diphosphate kinase [Candidatus Uhrbacteria bacterium]